MTVALVVRLVLGLWVVEYCLCESHVVTQENSLFHGSLLPSVELQITFSQLSKVTAIFALLVILHTLN
jgi:hypothetical protein